MCNRFFETEVITSWLNLIHDYHHFYDILLHCQSQHYANTGCQVLGNLTTHMYYHTQHLASLICSTGVLKNATD